MQLDMSTLKDFSSKQAELARLIQVFQNRRDWVLNLVIIASTIIAVNSIMTDQKSRTHVLTSQLSALDKKVNTVQSFENSQKEFNQFVESFPSGLGEPDAIIEKINVLAIANGIQIASLGPAARETQDLFVKTSVKATLNASDYKNLGQFVSEIENSPYHLRIDHWSATIKPSDTSRRQRNQQQDGGELPTITVEATIVSIELKNEN